MISISKAIDIVRQNVLPLGAETVELHDAVGRVLAEDIEADTDLPPFDRSQMDGFAVRADDTSSTPVILTIVGESAAGSGWHKTLKKGEAVRIMTGAPVPRGADAVQKVELTIEGSVSPQMERESVSILEPTKKGRYIVPKGFEVKKGQIIFHRGERVTAEMIAGLAAFGYEKVSVGVRPRLAVLATGSEIVDVGKRPGKDQIRNSNSFTVRALAEKFGCTVRMMPVSGDDLPQLRSAITSALASADLLVITGGVSVGKYDLTKTALSDVGSTILFESIRLKPGKPTAFAKRGDKLIFGLPGNPVSVAVTFELFVRMAVLMMQGCTDAELRSAYAIAAAPIKGAKERDSYLPAKLTTDRGGRLIANPIKWHGSSDFIGYAGADILVVVPRGKSYDKGDIVRIAHL
jgi:molybdenum cofactor synthesis domain-containing protein